MLKWENKVKMDNEFMERAIELAGKVRGKTFPNPLVGAVVVKTGKIVGEGYHEKAGFPHAEIKALLAAGAAAKGATLYTTLEPCSFQGRTPPCTTAIIKSGVKKVVIGLKDPNPKVFGAGISGLKKAGIAVKTGLLSQKISQQNEVYLKYIKSRVPFVLLKVAMSLDGKITSSNGQSWISGKEARALVHLLRAETQAIMIGIGTVLKDDPRLTVRIPGAKAESLLRVIVDSSLRIPLSSKIVKSALKEPTLFATTKKAPLEKIRALQKAGAEVFILSEREGQVNLLELLKELGKRGICALLVEGGARLNTSLIKEGVVDKFLFFVAPKLFGEERTLGLIAEAKKTFKFKITETKLVGEDLAITAYPLA